MILTYAADSRPSLARYMWDMTKGIDTIPQLNHIRSLWKDINGDLEKNIKGRWWRESVKESLTTGNPYFTEQLRFTVGKARQYLTLLSDPQGLQEQALADRIRAYSYNNEMSGNEALRRLVINYLVFGNLPDAPVAATAQPVQVAPDLGSGPGDRRPLRAKVPGLLDEAEAATVVAQVPWPSVEPSTVSPEQILAARQSLTERGMAFEASGNQSLIPRIASDVARHVVTPTTQNSSPDNPNAWRVLVSRLDDVHPNDTQLDSLRTVWLGLHGVIHADTLPNFTYHGRDGRLDLTPEATYTLAMLVLDPAYSDFVNDRIYQFGTMTTASQSTTLRALFDFMRDPTNQDLQAFLASPPPPQRVASRSDGAEFGGRATPAVLDVEGPGTDVAGAAAAHEVPGAPVSPPDEQHAGRMTLQEAQDYLSRKRLTVTQGVAGSSLEDASIIATAQRLEDAYATLGSRAPLPAEIPDELAYRLESMLTHRGNLQVTDKDGVRKQLALGPGTAVRISEWLDMADTDPIERENIRRHIVEFPSRDPEDQRRTLEWLFEYAMGERPDHPSAGPTTRAVGTPASATHMTPVASPPPAEVGHKVPRRQLRTRPEREADEAAARAAQQVQGGAGAPDDQVHRTTEAGAVEEPGEGSDTVRTSESSLYPPGWASPYEATAAAGIEEVPDPSDLPLRGWVPPALTGVAGETDPDDVDTLGQGTSSAFTPITSETPDPRTVPSGDEEPRGGRFDSDPNI